MKFWTFQLSSDSCATGKCHVCSFCSSFQIFATGFLQISPRNRHPCLVLCDSHYQGLLLGEEARCHIEQEEAGYTSCSRQGDKRRGSTHYSTCMHRSSQGICKMDAETSCRQVGEVGLCRLDLTYTGRSHPKKNEYKPHLKKCWCIPSKSSASFVATMEDVLEAYSRPFDNRRPVVRMDEKPVQLLAEA